MSKFQIGSIIFFIAVAILALLMFSGIIPTPGKKNNGGPSTTRLTIWGTLPADSMKDALLKIRRDLGTELSVTYIEKDKENLKVDLLSAHLDKTLPNLVLYPSDMILTLRPVLEPISADWADARLLKDTFIEGGEIFSDSVGVLGLPFVADPLVMYWNRDLFNSERITVPPKTWDDVGSLTRTLTKTDGRGRILQSAVAIGESRNVLHSKEILSLFFLQVGDSIVARDGELNEPTVMLGGLGNGKSDSTPAVSALSFYTGFANVRTAQYSWNGSFSSSLDSFVEGDVALYFGPASDYEIIKGKNPHLNFDVAPVPQLASGINVTYGRIYALGLPLGGSNPGSSFALARALTYANPNFVTALSQTLLLPSTSRAVLSQGGADATLTLFNKEALITKAWLDPNPSETEAIFARMINDTLSEAVKPQDAIASGHAQLNALVRELETKN